MNRCTWTLLLALLFFHAPVLAASERAILPVNELPGFTIPKGQVLYQRYCLFCHGENGAGDGQNAFSLPKRPADLKRIVSERNQEELTEVIKGDGTENSSGRIMPSFGQTLSDLETMHLVEYIRNLPEAEQVSTEDTGL